MLKNLTIGQYYPSDSVIHRLDPRVKIALTFAFIVFLFLARGATGYALMAAYSILAAAVSRIPAGILLRGLRPILVLVIIAFLIHLFITDGVVWFRVGPLVATREGARIGVLMATRIILLIFTTSLLTLTTSPIALTDGLERLMAPAQRFGIPVHELAMMITIALRFIPALLDEADRIMKAQMARGADFESGNVVQRARSLVPLLVPLFISAFRRADDLALAMEARCYRGGHSRTRLRQLRIGAPDIAACLVSLPFMVGVILLRMGWVRW